MPTTAGSGAEATNFSVIYIKGIKYSFYHPKLLAKNIICDVTLVKNAPDYIFSCSCIDALVQLIEPIWALKDSPKSNKYSFLSLNYLWHNIENAILKRDPIAIANIVKGSYYAGRTINLSKTTANHALSYKITTLYDIPHGHCLKMLLHKIIKLHEKIINKNKSNFFSLLNKKKDF